MIKIKSKKLTQIYLSNSSKKSKFWIYPQNNSINHTLWLFLENVTSKHNRLGDDITF